MLNKWIESSTKWMEEENENYPYLETTDWRLILYLTGCSDKTELLLEMSNNPTWRNELGPWVFEAELEGHNLRFEHLYGTDWLSVWIEPAS